MVDWISQPENQEKILDLLKFVMALVAMFASILFVLSLANPVHGEITASRVVTAQNFASAEVVGDSVIFTLREDAENDRIKYSYASRLTFSEGDTLKQVFRYREFAGEMFPFPTLEFKLIPSGDGFIFDAPKGRYLLIGSDVGSGCELTIGSKTDPAPDPKPDPDVQVPNEYGLGAIAYKLAPRGDPAQLAAMADAYKAAGEFLYGRPRPKFVSAPDHPQARDPEHNVLVWLALELKKHKAPAEYLNGVAAAFEQSQKEREFYKRADWYAAFNEVSEALRLVK